MADESHIELIGVQIMFFCDKVVDAFIQTFILPLKHLSQIFLILKKLISKNPFRTPYTDQQSCGALVTLTNLNLT